MTKITPRDLYNFILEQKYNHIRKLGNGYIATKYITNSSTNKIYGTIKKDFIGTTKDRLGILIKNLI